MNAVYLIVLLIANCSTLIWTFLYRPRSPFTPDKISFVHRPKANNEAGPPLHLTPLVDAGKFDEARNRSLVQPALGDIESYAGYLTVNRSTRSHLYFWFFPRTVSVEAPSPLILDLNGGPGCSSMTNVFVSSGPFEVEGDELQKREYAWTKEYNVLYVDQPIGTGFSYTENEENGYISSEAEVGEHLYEALRQFYKIFPKMLKSDFYISGVSYAGKYVPSLAHKIHIARNQPDAVNISLKGMMIGNGASDPMNLVPMSEYIYDLGLMEKDVRTKQESVEEEIMDLIRSEKWTEAHWKYSPTWKIGILRYVSVYDYTKERYSSTNDSFKEFLTQDRTRKSIHAGNASYAACSKYVSFLFYEDFLQSVRTWVEELLEHYPIMYYNGQFDLVCSHPNSKKFLHSLCWSGASAYGPAERRWWFVDDEAAFAYKSGHNLVDVLVRNAGHSVPVDQPKYGLELIRAFIEKKLYNAP